MLLPIAQILCSSGALLPPTSTCCLPTKSLPYSLALRPMHTTQNFWPPTIHIHSAADPHSAHTLHHPANHESLRPPIGASYHLTTFVPTRPPKQRETISERA